MTIIRTERSNSAYARDNTLTLTVYSSHLDRRQDVTIYNPNSQNKNLPVVILLHGVYGNNWVWMDLGGAHLVYEKLREQGLSECVLVMPSDGGIWDGSAYLPLQEGNFEQWIMDDVITTVKDNVDAISATSSWYITGLSMGGYGALRLGCKFAHRFKGITAHSAITHIKNMALFTDKPLSNYHTIDEHEADIFYWCIKNRQQLPPLKFDCGAQDELLGSNQQLASMLNHANIPHQFEINSGGHEWSYWHQHIHTSFKFFDDIERDMKLEKKSI